MIHVPDGISGAEKVIQVLGEWPTFHDAEVISFSAERALPFEADSVLARLAVHVRRYESVGEGTAQYELVLRKSAVLRFLFRGVSALELSDFNHQNVINSITVSRTITAERVLLSVVVEPIWGMGGSLECASVEIEAVEDLPV